MGISYYHKENSIKGGYMKRKTIKSIVLIGFILIYITILIFNQVKPLPVGLDYESEYSPISDSDIKFLSDITYSLNEEPFMEHEIFSEFIEVINRSEKFIIIDMFLFTDMGGKDEDYPQITKEVTDALIKKMNESEINVWIISDYVNTTYDSHEAYYLKQLQDNGANVVYAGLHELRDANPLYSTFYRMFFRWLPNTKNGWIVNPFGAEEPKVTLTSYLDLLNIKGNHRKMILTENESIFTSANLHDPSGFNSNTGVRVKGEILKDILASERAVVEYSTGNTANFPSSEDINIHKSEEDDLQVAIFTETKIYDEAVRMIKGTSIGEELWMGMYLLGNDTIVKEIQNASERGVKVKLILDPNQTSFGKEKPGIPNVAVTHRMNINDFENLEIRWYNIGKEQYHTKMIYIHGEKSQLFLGSTNLTSRSLLGYNLENNIKIEGDSNTQIMRDVKEYFEKLWNNKGQEYTVHFEEYQDFLSWGRRFVFRLQKILRVTTF